MDDIHGLRVWDSARALAKRCVEIARRNRLPDPSGLMEQLCRAASSVSANIAESMGAGTASSGCSRFALPIAQAGRRATT